MASILTHGYSVPLNWTRIAVNFKQMKQMMLKRDMDTSSPYVIVKQQTDVTAEQASISG